MLVATRSIAGGRGAFATHLVVRESSIVMGGGRRHMYRGADEGWDMGGVGKWS